MDGTARTSVRERLAVSAASAAVFIALYVWAVTTTAGQEFDGSTLALGAELREQWSEPTLARAADLAPWLIIVPTGLLLAVHALRGRWRQALIAGALPVVAYVVATALHDAVLPRPYLGDFGYEINTLPSERLAVAVACCCVLVWLAPRFVPRGVLVPVLAVTAAAVGALEVAAFSSRFADVVACAPLVGILAAWWLPFGAPRSRAFVAIGASIAALSGAVGALLMVGWAGAGYHPGAMTPGLIGTGLCVAAGVSALSLALRRQV